MATKVPGPHGGRNNRSSAGDRLDRADNLARLQNEHFDVVVIGGGITGAGVLLDAASRGLSAALIEADDFASQTSSKSSKFVHGGLRYLQQGDYKLVYEALRERQRLLRNAPHLVSLLPFLLPVMGKDGAVPKKLAKALGSAMWMYDLTGGWRVGRLHRKVSADQAHAMLPLLPRKHLAASYVYYDCAADDARLTLTVIKTAVINYGACAINRASASALVKSSGGIIEGVQAVIDGETITISARAVVNATGVSVDRIRGWDESSVPHSIRPAKGTHIVVQRDAIPCDIAVVLPVKGDKRSIFVAPWGDATYIGTTDTDYSGPVDHPQCDDDDVRYLLDAVNTALRIQLTPADVIGRWAGLRPLVAGEDIQSDSRTADLSRGQTLSASRSGVFTITGGKLTTYRHMAEDTIDAVVKQVFADPDHPIGKSQTKNLALIGAGASTSHSLLASWRHRKSVIQPTPKITPTDRLGTESAMVDALIAERPELAEPLVAGQPYLKAEAIHAVRNEMATTLTDVLTRRTRCGLFDWDATLAAAQDIASLIGPELGWSEAEIQRQVTEFARCDLAPMLTDEQESVHVQ